MAQTFHTMVFCALTLMTSLPATANADEVITLSVANSLRETLFKDVEEAFTKETGIKIKYIENEHLRSKYDSLTVVYFKDAIEGKADAALAATLYEEWVEITKKEKIVIPADITHRVIGRSTISIIANKDNGVSSLKTDQLVNVFSGQVKNWKEIGGKDVPVTIIHSLDKGLIRAAFKKMVMRGKEFGQNSVELARVQDIYVKIPETPGAIAYDSSVKQHPNIMQIKTSPFGRPVTLITKGKPNAKTEKLILFLRKSIHQ